MTPSATSDMHARRALHRLELHGLHVESERPLGELSRVGIGAGPTDIEIREAHQEIEPESHNHETVRVTDGVFVLDVPNVARFRVENGTSIVVQRHAVSDDDVVNGYLLGSVFGALLYQRGTPPLHASAVAIEGDAVVIAGHVGAGKTTTASALIDEYGAALISDDVTVVSSHAAGPVSVYPSLPLLRLRYDIARRLGRTGTRVRYADGDRLHARPRRFTGPDPTGASAFVVLEPNPAHHGAPVVNELRGGEAVSRIRTHLYRPLLVRPLGADLACFRTCTALATEMRVVVVEFTDAVEQLDELCDLIVSVVRGVPPWTGSDHGHGV